MNIEQNIEVNVGVEQLESVFDRLFKSLLHHEIFVILSSHYHLNPCIWSASFVPGCILTTNADALMLLLTSYTVYPTRIARSLTCVQRADLQVVIIQPAPSR